MASRSYISYTKADALATAMDASTTAVVLTDGATFPDPALPEIDPYSVIIAYGSSREEVCTVTAKPSANTLTVTRHEDGTLATAKNVGDIVVHGVSARDFVDTVRLDDPRLTDQRTPVPHAATHIPGGGDTVPVAPHASSHVTGGSDEITPASIGAATPADVAGRVADTGDTMTGQLTIDQSGPAVFETSPLVITRDLYPEIDLMKRTGETDKKRWRVYLSGPAIDPNPSLTFTALADDGITVLRTFRMYTDGRLVVGANPVDPLDAATKGYVDAISQTVTVALTPQNGYINDSPALGLTYNLTTARITGEIKRTSGTSMTVLNAGAIPAIARPPSTVTGVLISANGTDLGPVFYGKVNTDGSLTLMSFTGQPTWSSATVIGIHFTWAL